MKWILGGLAIAVISAFFGLAMAQLPAPTDYERALVGACMVLIVVGACMTLAGIFLVIRKAIVARQDRAQ